MSSLSTVHNAIDKVLFFATEMLRPGSVQIPCKLFGDAFVPVSAVIYKLQSGVVSGSERNFDLDSSCQT